MSTFIRFVNPKSVHYEVGDTVILGSLFFKSGNEIGKPFQLSASSPSILCSECLQIVFRENDMSPVGDVWGIEFELQKLQDTMPPDLQGQLFGLKCVFAPCENRLLSDSVGPQECPFNTNHHCVVSDVRYCDQQKTYFCSENPAHFNIVASGTITTMPKNMYRSLMSQWALRMQPHVRFLRLSTPDA